MPFSCIIFNDDLFASDLFTEYLGHIAVLNLVKSFSCPLRAIEEINKLFVNTSAPEMPLERPSILLKLGGKNKAVKLYIDEIILIEGASNYIKIHTVNKIYVPYRKMSAMENELKIYKIFERINRSFIISSRYIEKIDGYNIRLKNELSVSVSKSYRSHFDSFLNKLLKSADNNA